jgi:hypothetical protein
VPLSKDHAHGISVNALIAFDLLDTDHDGIITYMDLNKFLKVEDSQLQQFIRKIHDFGHGQHGDSSTITRDAFAAHCVNSIYHSAIFDASSLSSIIRCIKNHQRGDDRPANTSKQSDILYLSSLFDSDQDCIAIDKLYDSELASFLTDAQIYKVIRFFKTKSRDEPNETMEYDPNKIHYIQDAEQGFNIASRCKPRNRLRSRLSDVSTKIPMTDSTVTKDEFIRLYPDALLYATQHVSDNVPGVDVHFQDLSLYVRSGGNPIPIVNKVTGHIRQKQMTALMGSSGVGKTSLLNALCGRGRPMNFYGYVILYLCLSWLIQK